MEYLPVKKPWLGRSGTAVIKDWEVAGDIFKRGERYSQRRQRRVASLTSLSYPAPSLTGPLVRGAVKDNPSDFEAASTEWYSTKIDATFDELDFKGLGAITCDQLRTSFRDVGMPLDDLTFSRYKKTLPPLDGDGLDYGQFSEFHAKVWKNQPSVVRRFAGDPTAGLLPSGSQMKKSSSSPCILQEFQNNEQQARRVFARHCKVGKNKAEFQAVPDIFRDLGLDPGEYEMHMYMKAQSKRDDLLSTDLISFHDFVTLLNKFMMTLEAARRPISAGGPKQPKSPDAKARTASFIESAKSPMPSPMPSTMQETEDDEEEECDPYTEELRSAAADLFMEAAADGTLLDAVMNKVSTEEDEEEESDEETEGLRQEAAGLLFSAAADGSLLDAVQMQRTAAT